MLPFRESKDDCGLSRNLCSSVTGLQVVVNLFVGLTPLQLINCSLSGFQRLQNEDDATKIKSIIQKGNYEFVPVHATIYHHNKHFLSIKIIATEYTKIYVP